MGAVPFGLNIERLASFRSAYIHEWTKAAESGADSFIHFLQETSIQRIIYCL